MVILYYWKRPLKIICLVLRPFGLVSYRDSKAFSNQNAQLNQAFPKNHKKDKKRRKKTLKINLTPFN